MPRRLTKAKPSKQLRTHVETMTNYFMDVLPELSMDDAKVLASNLVTQPPEEVFLALRSTVWLHRPRRLLKEGDKRHGTINGYTNYGCRCDPCREANSKSTSRRKLVLHGKGLDPDDERHGTYNGYTNYGCRCDACKLAARDRYVK